MNGNIIFRLLKGAQSACDEQDYELEILFTNMEKQKKKTLEDLCRERNLGGIVLYGLKSTDTYNRELAALTIPCVGIDVEKAPVTVCTNNDQAVEEIIRLFAQKGKSRIGMINGSMDADISRVREMAYIRAMRALGFDVPLKSVRYADYFEQKAYEETFKLMNDRPELEGIFAASDQMALGVIRALKEMGKKIPEDVAVAGIDGIQIGEYITPSLTTVVQQFKEMGRRAVFLLERMQKGETVNYIEYVDHVLVERQSV